MSQTAIRIDKYLWAVRLFKTRSVASEECRKGRVFIDDVAVKPSRIISIGDIFTLKRMPVTYRYKIIKPLEKRVSAKLVPEYLEDITPPEELIKLQIAKSGTSFGKRQRGAGRPTKRERREIDEMRDNLHEKE